MPSIATRPRIHWGFAALAVAGLVAVGCGDDASDDADDAEARCAPEEPLEAISAEDVAAADFDGVTIRLMTHDSFVVSDGVFEAFESETGIEVEVLRSGDAGQMVSQAVITAGNPVADVMFGIDNTFMCRGIAGNVFHPYESPALDAVAEDLRLDPTHHLTPVDTGEVCINYSVDAFSGELEPPESLEDLTDPAYEGLFVTQNPETSSPGFAFLLATIARFGDPGWEDYWQALRDNDVRITSGWSEAYNEDFQGGGGPRPIVNSYASSPVVEVLFAEPAVDAPPTAVLTDSCFRQVELAGVLAGTEHPLAAARLVDFLVSPTFQEDIPLNMFVYPVNQDAALPEVFAQHATTIEEPLTMEPAEIEAGRSAWTDRWTEIVLR